MGLGLVGLPLHLAGDDPSEAEAWAASDEVLWFRTSAGRGWGEAVIPAGQDAEVARAAAERMIAAKIEPPGDV